MKKIAFLALTLLIGVNGSNLSAQEVKDTSVVFNLKTILIKDSLDRIKIKVQKNGNGEFKTIFEGIYTQHQTLESYGSKEELILRLPFARKLMKKNIKTNNCRPMEAHWAGFGFGKLTTSDDQFNIGYTDGMPMNKGKSNEIYLNLIDGIQPIFHNIIGITSGFGLDWRNFHFENNSHLVDNNGITIIEPALTGVKYSYSRLRTLHLTIPLMLEWQPVLWGKKSFFASAGTVAGWNVMATYRVKYTDSEGHKQSFVESRGLHTNPLSLDLMCMLGYNNLSFYAKYSPFGVFQDGKGPKINQTSLGLVLLF